MEHAVGFDTLTLTHVSIDIIVDVDGFYITIPVWVEAL